METRKNTKLWERTNISNLYRRGESQIYYARLLVNKKDKWKSLGTKSFKIAKLLLADLCQEERAKVVRSATAATQIDGGKCGKLLDIYLMEARLDTKTKPASKSRLETAAKAITKTWPEFHDTDVRKITPLRCKQWAHYATTEGTKFIPPLTNPKLKPKGMSPSSFNQTLSVLRNVFALASKVGLIYEDPSKDIQRIPPGKKRLALPTTAQFSQIVDTIANAGARQSKDCADMVKLLAYSGMRLQESTNLTWEQVDFDRETLHVTTINENETLKTKYSERTIPLFPPLKKHLAAILQKRKQANPEIPVPKNARVLQISECQKSLTSACSKVGVKRLTHHDLRHLFATYCIESGVDIPTVSRWLGHADGGALAMRTYGHLRQEHSQTQAKKITWE